MRNKQYSIAQRHLLGVGLLAGSCVVMAAVLMSGAAPDHAVAVKVAKTAHHAKLNGASSKLERIGDVLLVKVTKGNIGSLPQNSTSTTGVGTINNVLREDGFKFKVSRLLRTNRKSDLNSDFARWIKITISNPGPATTNSQGSTDYANVDALMTQLRQLPNVQSVESDLSVPLAAVTPNDPYFSSTGTYVPGMQDMWGLYAMHLPQAWQTTTGSSSVTVAVVDGGVNITHSDLAANIWTNPGEIAGNGIDDDGNGYIDDVNGWNFVFNDNQLKQGYYLHGTHVAGIIGAVGNNGIGVVGVNWHVKLMPLAICGPTIAPLAPQSAPFSMPLIRAQRLLIAVGALSNWGTQSRGKLLLTPWRTPITVA